jgi:hypothetical protein
MDLKSSLDSVAGRAVEPTVEQIEADLDRGRGALRRRRNLQAVAGASAAVVAIVAAAITFTVNGRPADDFSAAAPATAQAPAKKSVKLVPWVGEQPKYFTVAKVPDGWIIQQSPEHAEYGLAVSPTVDPNTGKPEVVSSTPSDSDEDRERLKDKGIRPSGAALADPNSFEDKIAIMLNSSDAGEPKGTKVKVGDREGVLSEPTDFARTVFIKQDGGKPWLVVQIATSAGLSKDQMIEFATGVTVEDGAKQGVG